MAFAEKRSDAALTLVKKQIALAPKAGGLVYLLGTVHLARGEQGPAEGAFLNAIELEPNLLPAYVQLANIYAPSKRYDEALTKLNDVLKVSPRSLPAHMLIGIVYEAKGDVAKAQQAYEKALALNPRFAPAANNLAWLYSEHGGDKEKAFGLAQTAREVAPDDPYISDTLGWILYKRGVYQRAASLLKEGASKLPDNPLLQYHFGLASFKIGDKETARQALTAAVKSPMSFSERDEASKVLAELK